MHKQNLKKKKKSLYFSTSWIKIRTFDNIHEYVRSFAEYDKEKVKERRERKRRKVSNSSLQGTKATLELKPQAKTKINRVIFFPWTSRLGTSVCQKNEMKWNKAN